MRTNKYSGNNNDEMRMLGTTSASATFDSIMGYLHSIPLAISTKKTLYRQLKSEVADENFHYLCKRLKEFATLKDGWDAYGEAKAVNPIVIDHVEKILEACRPSDLTEWRLFPNVNGTMLFELDDASISIGVDSFTFFAEVGGMDVGEEYQPFSVKSVVDTIRKINSYYA